MYNNYSRDNMIKPTIVAYASGDVNGDRIPDNVYLTGIKTYGSQFIENITLEIHNGMTGEFTNITFSDNDGYNPTIFLGDFTGNHVDDILIGINSGGSGGIMYYYIYSFINNKEHLLLDFNVYNELYKYDVIYKDNYKVEVISKTNKQKYIIDISNRGLDYLNEIYYANGKLKVPINGFVNPISGLYPVDFDSDGVYELLAYQKIAGRYNADALGYVLNTLKWENNKFDLYNQNIAIFGAEI
ncbi:VCBS repeat-containing protein [Clostridium estertheticum]|uniref:VCBS repeat-containing protein n=1 Tax=Clostridium estertheticum TaxID=238834 RepID=A0AA47I8I1_9CLOT|nr:VCBS repeat-containing protein [Clostridium estertheticum]MBU3154456.1 VCBS repeat-containing protein [Clostridium estertheticum]WAG62105.1 VCBS repeat-containing protein [Clostridium estertheticum]